MIQDVACTVCGCVCDDLRVQVSDGVIQNVENACHFTEPWLLEKSQNCDRPYACVDGQAVAFEQAVSQSAEILSGSRAPLVYGMSNCGVAGMRAACRLSDRIGATIDATASHSHAASVVAIQASGESTATLGEIRHRSDVVVYWGSNPLVSQPRHIERFIDSPGMFMPAGRQDRHLVVVDTTRTPTAEIADTFIQLPAGADFEVIWALRALIQGTSFDEKNIGGVATTALLRLADLLKSARYGAIFYGSGLTSHHVPHATVEALLRLVTELNAHTRFVTRAMRNRGDAAGSDGVLSWQTGYPMGVNLARGYPRYNPGEHNANALLERQEVDAAIVVGADSVGRLSLAARSRLQAIPTVVLDAQDASSYLNPSVQIATATDGVHRNGTTYRMDDVSIPLRKLVQSDLPSDEEVLLAIEDRIEV
ncbi:MAG: formylmethanofuran dehydrogenase subunit B [Planctomycetota bacterium]